MKLYKRIFKFNPNKLYYLFIIKANTGIVINSNNDSQFMGKYSRSWSIYNSSIFTEINEVDVYFLTNGSDIIFVGINYACINGELLKVNQKDNGYYVIKNNKFIDISDFKMYNKLRIVQKDSTS